MHIKYSQRVLSMFEKKKKENINARIARRKPEHKQRMQRRRCLDAVSDEKLK